MKNILLGDVIRVTQTYVDEDSGINFENWSGRIRQIATDEHQKACVLVEWVADTIYQMQEMHIVSCFAEEIPWTTAILPLSVIEKGNETSDDLETEWAKQAIIEQYLLPKLGCEGKRILKVFEKANKALFPFQIWLNFLENVVRFPIAGQVCYPYEPEDGPLAPETKVQINSLANWDNPLGIFCTLSTNGHEYCLPLQDLEAIGELSKSVRWVNAYGLWMLCRS